MKAVVIQEEIRQTDITKGELTVLWERLGGIPEITDLKIVTDDVYPSLDKLDEYIGDCDAIFGVWLGSDILNEEFLSRHKNLKYIATLGHGYGTFDKEMTRRLGITIVNTVYGAQTIAEHGMALLMEACHHIALADSRTKNTDWTDPVNSHSYDVTVTRQIELYGKTMGIAGLGSIGTAMARMASGFGMKVLGFSRHKKNGPEYDFVEQVDTLDELLERSDVISLNMPHTPESEKIIDSAAISKMKEGAIIVNTARGQLIDEQALADALKSGKVYAAALDVLSEEPPVHGSPLLTAPNCIITSHIAWLTRESRIRAINMAIDAFESYLKGKPVSVIN